MSITKTIRQIDGLQNFHNMPQFAEMCGRRQKALDSAPFLEAGDHSTIGRRELVSVCAAFIRTRSCRLLVVRALPGNYSVEITCHSLRAHANRTQFNFFTSSSQAQNVDHFECRTCTDFPCVVTSKHRMCLLQ